MNKKSAFITLEGIDFSGKSTQAERLLSRLHESGLDPLFLREPGGTVLSERVREILLNRGEITIGAKSELLLFLAARAQLVDDLIIPSLESGRIVICDRFFDSTFAYQGFARGLPVEKIREINTFATSGLVPDLTLLFDLPVEVAQGRGAGLSSGGDRLENEVAEFHRRVRDGYLQLVRTEPMRIKVIDASGSLDVVWSKTWELTRSFLKTRGIEILEK
ncbi:MAG: dTMP kinase [candidate division Zixibacteria bacterium]|nr:dTMP kinase [candidate division Zixibacteria bacterium]MBU1469674.1 dTMP kinase [candidate division Zixibacteria bacterium]